MERQNGVEQQKRHRGNEAGSFHELVVGDDLVEDQSLCKHKCCKEDFSQHALGSIKKRKVSSQFVENGCCTIGHNGICHRIAGYSRQKGQQSQQQQGKGVVVFKNSYHVAGSKFKLCKANIVLVHAGYDNLSETNLFAKFGHEFIIPVEVLQCRLSLYSPLSINGG